MSNVSPQNNFYIFVCLDKKRSWRMLWIHECKATDGYSPWRDDVPFETVCRKLSVSLKVEMATEAGLFFLLRYLQVNNLCPTSKSRENQCVVLLCEPSWHILIIWGKLSFNRFGFHMAIKDVVRHWTRHSKLRWTSRLFFLLSPFFSYWVALTV